jgi:hypothetical protein
MRTLDLELLNELFYIDPEVGVLMNRVKRHTAKAGEPAGGTSTKGYMKVSIRQGRYYIHRIAYALYYGKWPEHQIDHKNHNRIDNRKLNLRDVTSQVQQKNRSKPVNNVSGVVGVSFHTRCGKWQVTIAVAGKNKYLGLFSDFDEACQVRKAAEVEYDYHFNHGR